MKKPKIGIIGGSGLCTFNELKKIQEIKPMTRYGLPSEKIEICEYANQLVAFLPRHGSSHSIAPHKVPYKANVAALKEIGVEYILGTCIAGSLKKEITPGSFVIPNQFVNFTWGRDDYVEADGYFIHLPMGEPYCEHLRQKIIETAKINSLKVFNQGTVVVIQGPRFSTIAESQWFSANGWDLVNMTQYPEGYFARELGICYAVIAAITDYDVGLLENLTFKPQNTEHIVEIFTDNVRKTKELILTLLSKDAQELNCKCASVIRKAYYENSL